MKIGTIHHIHTGMPPKATCQNEFIPSVKNNAFLLL